MESQEKLRPSEIAEARRIVGNAIIEKNESLQGEIINLLDILREYSSEVEKRQQAVDWQSRLSKDMKKEQLEREIHSFIAALRSKSSTPVSLRPATARERTVLSFFVGEDQAQSRPKSARELLTSRSGIDKRFSESISNRPKTAELVSEVLIDKSDTCVMYDKLESIASAIRQELLIEQATFMEDIEFLHLCIDNEHERDLQSCIQASAPPTESELLDFKGKLQVCAHLLNSAQMSF
jgi:hypothetical protein